MSKPKWLKDVESGAERIARKVDLCADCAYFGKPVKFTKRKTGETVEVHECDVHPKCLNTKYSICCDDWAPANLL